MDVCMGDARANPLHLSFTVRIFGDRLEQVLCVMGLKFGSSGNHTCRS